MTVVKEMAQGVLRSRFGFICICVCVSVLSLGFSVLV